ncbi:hypothetical protein HPB48_003946 [Haemaphysalis longicornis]|uniref:Nuclease HARBI1 n=1 Tax=Haemaphysalis longicornis TaxID=44386 RepID=A0A9J6GE38_HAELO|nr:hypothetical protein HPB48_003946 [Haemaphysalis longicornis]
MAVPFVVALIESINVFNVLDQRVRRLHRDAFLLSADAFRRQYRLTKALVRWVCERLRGELTRVRGNTATSLTVELPVLCALRFFATGSFQGMVATDEHLATSQSAASSIIEGTCFSTVSKLQFCHCPPRKLNSIL